MALSDQDCIRQCIALSEQAARKGNHPFGALLVCDDEILLRAENTVNSEHDRTRHAELNLISQATRAYDEDIRLRCTLYSSTEPCPMCSGAIYWASIGRVVFGCSMRMLHSITGRAFGVSCRQILGTGEKKIEVIGPVLEDEASKIHRDFWVGRSS